MGEHTKTQTSFWVDAAERVGMQAAYAVVTEVAVIIPDSHIPQAYVPIIMLGLNVIKVAITKFLNGTGGVVKSPAPVETEPVTDSPTPSVG